MVLLLRNASILRRVSVLHRILTVHKDGLLVQKNLVRALNTNGKVTIDGITKELKEPLNPEFVPQKFCKSLRCLVIELIAVNKCRADQLFGYSKSYFGFVRHELCLACVTVIAYPSQHVFCRNVNSDRAFVSCDCCKRFEFSTVFRLVFSCRFLAA